MLYTPSCDLRCLLSSDFILNDSPQILHMCGFASECRRLMWIFTMYGVAVAKSQYGHLEWFSCYNKMCAAAKDTGTICDQMLC